MPRRQLRLDVADPSGISARVLAEYGPHAEIVAAEKVTVGGIAGFLARQYYEVTIDLPIVTPDSPYELDLPARLGMAALLADADEAETRLSSFQGSSFQGRTAPPGVPSAPGNAVAPAFAAAPAAPAPAAPAAPVPAAPAAPAAPAPAAPAAAVSPDRVTHPVSTASVQFDELMDSLNIVEPPSVPARSVPSRLVPSRPVLLTKPGDLVLLVGVREDPLRVTRALTAATDSTVCVAGTIVAPSGELIADRRGANEARARGVRNGRATFVALGLASAPSGTARAAELVAAIAPDQVWVVVDAGRKSKDTAAWVAAISAIAPVDAMAVLGYGDTASPETLDELGLPVGWTDSLIDTGSRIDHGSDNASRLARAAPAHRA